MVRSKKKCSVKTPLPFLLCLAVISAWSGGVMAAAGGRIGGERIFKCPSPTEIEPCTCQVKSKGKGTGLEVLCHQADIQHVENTVNVLKKPPQVIYWMRFRNSNLPRIKDFIFLGLEVIHLSIIRSNVARIDRGSLSALGGSLESLDLSYNNISEVPTDSLRTLTRIAHLNLNYNKIRHIQADAFSGMVFLERLSLYENWIDTIDENAFKGIGRKLVRLNLGKNKLKNIPTHAFHPLVGLEVLDLHENHIKHIPDKAFGGLINLDLLKLEYNQIDQIQAGVFHDLKKLNSLNIEHNVITNVSDEAFFGLEGNLGWLELGNNKLDHIPSHAFRPLHNLRQLDLDTNRIRELSEDAFKGYGDTLKYILLDHNHIKTIPSMAFMDLHSLEWLKLSNNELTTLPEDTVLPVLDTLTMIDISNNPLICDCEIIWLKRWLGNPNNAKNVKTIDEHVCITADRKSHKIKNLPENIFNCPFNKIRTSIYEPSEPAMCESCNGMDENVNQIEEYPFTNTIESGFILPTQGNISRGVVVDIVKGKTGGATPLLPTDLIFVLPAMFFITLARI